jgi:hypothetical protein
MFDVVNNDAAFAAKKLRPIGKAHAFFRRIRISIRGQIIEDIDNYHWVSELFHILGTRHSRTNDMVEEFGYNSDIWALNDTDKLPGITNSQTVMCQPFCGIFQQTKYLPLRYAPLEVELELADAADPIISSGFAEEASVVAGVFKASNASVLWEIENCMVKVGLCTRDNALDNPVLWEVKRFSLCITHLFQLCKQSWLRKLKSMRAALCLK